jgi:2-dehydro-3-deoxygluconokinase
MIERHPNLKVVATTLRDVHSASRHDLGGAYYSASDGSVHEARGFKDLEVLDRVGSGDAFAAGLIHGLLSEQTLQRSIDIAVAAGALALASLGDGLSASLSEIEKAASENDTGAIR